MNNMMRLMSGMGGYMGMDPEHAFLVQRVKNLQRQEGGKEKWEAFVMEKGGGKKDPSLKNSLELKEFLLTADPEGASDLAANGQTPETLRLSQQVRAGQKA